jgi:pimeloyl-ACP methyl ester carboxylesterase
VAPRETEKGEGGDFDKVEISSEPKPDYAPITVPALALYAAPRTWKEMMPEAPEFTNAEQDASANKVVAQMAKMRQTMAEQFRANVAQSRVVELPGASHYLFRTNEDDVVREILTFVRGLDR